MVVPRGDAAASAPACVLLPSHGALVDAFSARGVDVPPAPRQHASRDTVTSRGFSLVTKQRNTIMQADGTQTQQVNLAIEIVVDMFNTIDHDAMAMVVRGHGGFPIVTNGVSFLHTRKGYWYFTN